MAETQIEEIKQKADIVGIIGERVRLKKAGRNFKALCPFHSEKTPSFNVSSELQIYKCFGCDRAGDVFSFLEEYEGMTFPEALEHVANKVGVKLTTFQPSEEQQRRKRLLSILDLASEYYHYLLTKHKVGEEAREYLKQRGVWQESIKTFQLGYAPDSWEGLQKYLVDKKKYQVEDVAAAGLVIKRNKPGRNNGGYYDRFRGRVMFSLKNQRGQVLGFSGRILDKKAREAKYINSPETSLYHKGELLYGLATTKQAIKKADQVVVMEGELDVLSSWQAGVKQVVAIKGSALTEDQIRLVSRYSYNLVLALDADQAGDRATKRGIALADSAGVNVRVVELLGGKDPDEIIQKDKKKWQMLVPKAVSVYDFYLSSALKRWDAKSGEGKRRISRELGGVWASISNQVEQAHYIKKLAQALEVDEEVVVREVTRASEGLAQTEKSQVRQEPKPKEKGLTTEEYVLGLVLRSGDKVFERAKQLKPRWFGSRGVMRVVEVLGEKKSKKFLQEGKWDIGGFVKSLPEELKELAQKVWLEAEAEAEAEEAEVARLFIRSVQFLQQTAIRARLDSLADKIGILDKTKNLSKKDQQKLGRLQKQFVKASSELKELL